MASGALFGNTAARNSSSNLVEFRAGKMFMKGNMVHPDKRKGLVYLHQSDDSLIHFCWKDRTSGTVEDDLIIFPDDCEFKHVKQCTTGRVFLLKFKNTNRKLFFWMQEPKNDKDDDNCKKINEYMNNPPVPGSRSSSAGMGGAGIPPGAIGVQPGGGLGGIGGAEDLQHMLGGMNQQQLMQLLGVSGLGHLGGLSSLLGGNTTAGAGGGMGGSPLDQLRSPAAAAGAAAPRSANTSTSQPALATAAATPATPSTTNSNQRDTSDSAAAVTVTTPATASATTPAATGSSSQLPRPATGPGAGQTAAPLPPLIQLSDLQSILSGMNVAVAGVGSGAGAPPQAPQTHLDLAGAMSQADLLRPLLARSEVVEQLAQHLPDTGSAAGATGTGTESDPGTELLASTQSPQFQQSLSLFSAALQSGQLAPLMAQFGYGDGVVQAAAAGNMEQFLKAIQEAHGKSEGVMNKEKNGGDTNAAKKEEDGDGGGTDKKNDGDDDMDDAMELD